MDIGLVGLGSMGLPMGKRLIEAGHHLTVYDIRRDALDQFVALGAAGAGSPREVADAVETVMTSLPTPAIVRDVALGSEGAIHGRKIRRLIEMSTTGSETAVTIGAALLERGIAMLDSPVSGGVGGAVKGTLAVIVSGPRADFELVKSALEVIGKVFFVSEKSGLAQTMKLANNFLSATALAATSEAVALGAKAGLDPGMMIDIINAGSGRNSASQDKFPRSVLPGSFDFGFAMGLMVKDL
ncbi:MAG TPA: NAD(P)-dependent oxidoreductase, partial [Aestuariivirgaceae bacterium]|nr:NAD(P)-dependent oxidoreductase [Aestuariivirgaceae bacterium]